MRNFTHQCMVAYNIPIFYASAIGRELISAATTLLSDMCEQLAHMHYVTMKLSYVRRLNHHTTTLVATRTYQRCVNAQC